MIVRLNYAIHENIRSEKVTVVLNSCGVCFDAQSLLLLRTLFLDKTFDDEVFLKIYEVSRCWIWCFTIVPVRLISVFKRVC